jgi:hypothetical protein
MNVRIELTLHGAVATANILAEMGYPDEATRARIAWLYQSGVAWENREFRKSWQTVRKAAGRALEDMVKR